MSSCCISYTLIKVRIWRLEGLLRASLPYKPLPSTWRVSWPGFRARVHLDNELSSCSSNNERRAWKASIFSLPSGRDASISADEECAEGKTMPSYQGSGFHNIELPACMWGSEICFDANMARGTRSGATALCSDCSIAFGWELVGRGRDVAVSITGSELSQIVSESATSEVNKRQYLWPKSNSMLYGGCTCSRRDLSHTFIIASTSCFILLVSLAIHLACSESFIECKFVVSRGHSLNFQFELWDTKVNCNSLQKRLILNSTQVTSHLMWPALFRLRSIFQIHNSSGGFRLLYRWNQITEIFVGNRAVYTNSLPRNELKELLPFYDL